MDGKVVIVDCFIPANEHRIELLLRVQVSECSMIGVERKVCAPHILMETTQCKYNTQ